MVNIFNDTHFVLKDNYEPKITLASVVAALTLTACSKPADESSQANPSAEHATMQDEHTHAHEHHDDHAGHMHIHTDGDAYQWRSDSSYCRS